jgi:hypothetical protein
MSNHAQEPITRRTLVKAGLAGGAAMAGAMLLSGCMGKKSSGGTQVLTRKVVKSTIPIERNTDTPLYNGALVLTFTKIQRRPVSAFAGGSYYGTSSGSIPDTISRDAVGTNIAIAIDIEMTWNANTYMKSAGDDARLPSKLADLIIPGSTLYIQGTDADGGDYTATQFITPPPSSGSGANGAIESQIRAANNARNVSAAETIRRDSANREWDYDILNSPLPETSEKRGGSIIVMASSSASNLQLDLIQYAPGVDPSDEEAVANSDASYYIVDLENDWGLG